jgi:hypothetical protein
LRISTRIRMCCLSAALLAGVACTGSEKNPADSGPISTPAEGGQRGVYHVDTERSHPIQESWIGNAGVIDSVRWLHDDTLIMVP